MPDIELLLQTLATRRCPLYLQNGRVEDADFLLACLHGAEYIAWQQLQTFNILTTRIVRSWGTWRRLRKAELPGLSQRIARSLPSQVVTSSRPRTVQPIPAGSLNIEDLVASIASGGGSYVVRILHHRELKSYLPIWAESKQFVIVPLRMPVIAFPAYWALFAGLVFNAGYAQPVPGRLGADNTPVFAHTADEAAAVLREQLAGRAAHEIKASRGWAELLELPPLGHDRNLQNGNG
jgi:hypothetical protein